MASEQGSTFFSSIPLAASQAVSPGDVVQGNGGNLCAHKGLCRQLLRLSGS